MLAEAQTLAADVDDWLGRFDAALAQGDDDRLRTLFQRDAYWRDVVALTWRIATVRGADAIVAGLRTHAGRTRPAGFATDPRRASPRQVIRAGTEAIEAIFRFETADGTGVGVLRLVRDGTALKAWTLLTALDQLRGHEERIGRARPRGESHARDFRGPNWLDHRKAAAAYEGRDPAVLVVGAGQAGLSIAARLTQLGIDALVVDREARIGDNWRRRYHALTLHNQVQVNHLPYMPFPSTWPTYIPKDKLAGWFEAYAESMELNIWTGTAFEQATYDAAERRWSVVLGRADGTTRALCPRHIVMATGLSGAPSLPNIPTLPRFAGTVLHSSRYEDGAAWAGRKALVIGSGNSGHDIAQDLFSAGADVALVQRSPTLVVNIEPSAQLPYTLYDEDLPLDDCDLITMATPFAVARKSHIGFTAQARALDRDLLEGLERVGFRLDFGEDGSGWQFKYLTRGGGYYFNVGCSDLIADRKVGLVQYADIEAFVAEGARLRSGATLPADLIVLATGYRGQEHLVRQLFGAQVADRVGPIWGFGAGDELRNMFVRTPQPGLWFIAGSLAQCRIYSKPLALQIAASEAGLID